MCNIRCVTLERDCCLIVEDMRSTPMFTTSTAADSDDDDDDADVAGEVMVATLVIEQLELKPSFFATRSR